ncbi:MAG: hypothetical protein B6A08_08225 [Sorangiineae bacterium NIC37A_2]|nr:MAG: hypothetical protein B6A08_08225 [Sorangiineae bacterium NIC37A_2]
MFEFLTDILDEWSGEDADELFELLEAQLGEVGIQLKLDAKDAEVDDDVDDEDEDDEDDDVEPDDDDEVGVDDVDDLGGGDFDDDE